MGKKIVFLFIIAFFFSSCKHSEEVKDLQIDVAMEHTRYKNIQACTYSLSDGQFRIVHKLYTYYDYINETKIEYLVDENNIIRRAMVLPIDMRGIHKTYETPEGYSIYTDITSIDPSLVKDCINCPFNGKLIVLKSGWCLRYGDIPENDLDIRMKCNLLRIDVNYFKLLEEKVRLKKITSEWNTNRSKIIREEIKKEGIPYG